MSPRQRSLPLGRVKAERPGRAAYQAKCDLTPMGFAAALARNGFRQCAGGATFADTTGITPVRFVGALKTRRGDKRLDRRATLAKIIRERAKLQDRVSAP